MANTAQYETLEPGSFSGDPRILAGEHLAGHHNGFGDINCPRCYPPEGHTSAAQNRPFRFVWEDAVVQSERVTQGVLLTALNLARYGGKDGINIFVSQKTLAQQEGYKKHQTVGEHMEVLRDLGFIERVKRGNHTTHESDTYRLRLPGN